MKMKLDLVLNYISFKYFMKMTRTKGFRNLKNQSQDWIKGSIENKKKLKLRLNVHFEIKNWTTPTTTGVQTTHLYATMSSRNQLCCIRKYFILCHHKMSPN
jgi:hypothetical protein